MKRLLRQANYDYESTYYVVAYLYTNYTGIMDDLSTNDWSAVEEFAHEHLYKGNLIEIVNNETGASVRLNPDEYFEDFNGEFPVKSWDLE